MKYKIDLRYISIKDLKDSLLERELLPSRQVLLSEIDLNFDKISKTGIKNLASLYDHLRTKKKLVAYADKSTIDPKYLRILKREISSFVPKPVRLEDFAGFSEEFLFELELEGIKSSQQLFEKLHSPASRRHFATKQGISIGKLNELFQLSSLVRIYGIGTVFARVIIDSGIKSAEEFLSKDTKYLCKFLSEAYLKSGYKQVDFTERDIATIKYYAKFLDL